MAKGDSWNQALSRGEKGEERARTPVVRERESSRKSPLAMAAAMLGMAVVALALVLFVLKPLLVPADPAQAKPKLPSHSLGSVVVNVAETEGRRYLKASVEVEPGDPKAVREIERRRSQLVDITIGLLSSKGLTDVTTAEGRDRIKKELMERMNAELGDQKIAKIYFVEFVVQ